MEFKPPKKLRYLFLDLNSYFASAEQHLNPALRGRPVAVAPIDTEATCAIAASYEAKAQGVRMGTRIYEARRICPELVVVPARPDRYVEIHHAVMEEIERHIPIHKVCSIDEAVCRLMGPQCVPEAAVALARRIKQGIARNVGAALRSSIGIAPSVLLAKLGTEMEKPDGLVVLTPDRLPQALEGLTLKDIPGIGSGILRRLALARIGDVQGLWNMQPKHARKVWGSVQGERFWYAFHGYDVPDAATSKRSIGHGRVLAPECRNMREARLVSRSLVLKAARRLRRYGLMAGRLSLDTRVEFLNRRHHTHWRANTLFLFSQDSFIFLDALDGMWSRLAREIPEYTRPKSLSVTLSRLREAGTVTPDLFRELEGEMCRTVEAGPLWQALDKLNRRYGPDTVNLASQSGMNMQYLGTKIAFTRIPDREEFKE